MSWEQAPPSRGLRPWLRPAIAVVALIALVTFLLLTRSAAQPGTLTIGPTAEPALEASTAPSVNPSDFAPTPLDPLDGGSEIAGGGPLLPDGPMVTVVTADDQNLRSINIATGDIRRSGLLAGSERMIDPWTLFAVGGNVITNAGESVVSITSTDHQRVRLARNHLALPTLDDASVWVMEGPNTLPANTLLRMKLDGTITDRIALPAVAQPQAGVGASVFVWTPGGIHAVSGDGIRRITSSGLLEAVSADRLAWFDCAADLTCHIVIGTHDDPDQVHIPVASSELPAGFFGATSGKFSPDGRRVALPLLRLDAEQTIQHQTIAVFDTATGAELARLPEREQSFEGTPLDWSPDAQWLFVGAGNRVLAWNAANGDVTRIEPRGSGPIRGLAVIQNS
jgi:WD40 repeat protein